jgi:hypothetical protein
MVPDPEQPDLQGREAKRVAIVQPGDPYLEIEQKVRAAIEDHFTSQIGRPERRYVWRR